MLRAWADKLVRLGAGGALVLLLAAEQKVCPWLLKPPTRTEVPRDQIEPAHGCSETQTPTADSPAPAKPKRPPLSLVRALPDALPARQHVPGSRAVWQASVGHRDGVVVCGTLCPEPVSSAPCALTCDPFWTLLCRPPRLVELAGPQHEQPFIPDPAVATLLLRTGPPVA